jgi:hypothetical protein
MVNHRTDVSARKPRIHGRRGMLHYVGPDKAQCHVCGKAFKALGLHVVQAHGMSCDEYRREFRLPPGLGLVGSSLHERFSEVHGPRLLETLKLANARSGARLKQLATDPAWVRARAETASAVHGGRATEARSCVICRTVFVVRRSSRRKTCQGIGSPCHRVLQRRLKRTAATRKRPRAASRARKMQIKTCPVCSHDYVTPLGTNQRQTCGQSECVRGRARQTQTGRRLAPETRARIAAHSRRRMTSERARDVARQRVDAAANKMEEVSRTIATSARPWVAADVMRLGVSRKHAAAILSRLVKRRALVRVGRGLYVVAAEEAQDMSADAQATVTQAHVRG